LVLFRIEIPCRRSSVNTLVPSVHSLIIVLDPGPKSENLGFSFTSQKFWVRSPLFALRVYFIVGNVIKNYLYVVNDYQNMGM
jgi:hypothetical protein